MKPNYLTKFCYMKRIFSYPVLFLFFVGILFSSCESSDGFDNYNPSIDDILNPGNPGNPGDPGNPQPTSAIVGKWAKVGISDGSNGEILYHDHACATTNDFIEFMENGTVRDVTYLPNCTIGEEGSGTFSVDGDILTITGNDPDGELVSGEITILTLTDSALELYVEDSGISFVIVYEAY